MKKKNEIFLAPFVTSTSSPKCTRVCQNDGICLVKIEESIEKNTEKCRFFFSSSFLCRLMNPIKNNAYANHPMQGPLVN